jgi:hypothetical protein
MIVIFAAKIDCPWQLMYSSLVDAVTITHLWGCAGCVAAAVMQQSCSVIVCHDNNSIPG